MRPPYRGRSCLRTQSEPALRPLQTRPGAPEQAGGGAPASAVPAAATATASSAPRGSLLPASRALTRAGCRGGHVQPGSRHTWAARVPSRPGCPSSRRGLCPSHSHRPRRSARPRWDLPCPPSYQPSPGAARPLRAGVFCSAGPPGRSASAAGNGPALRCALCLQGLSLLASFHCTECCLGCGHVHMPSLNYTDFYSATF